MDHSEDEAGISALLDVIDKRLDPSLLEAGVARSFSEASGGNIRDLFDLLKRAGLASEVRGSGKIEHRDAVESVQELRSNYRFRLGENVYDAAPAMNLI